MIAIENAFAAALEAVFLGDPALAGTAIHRAPPPGARPPFISVGPGAATRQGHKGGETWLLRLPVTVWAADDAALDAPMRAVARTMPAAPPGIRLLACAPERIATRRPPAGLAAGVTEYRILFVMED